MLVRSFLIKSRKGLAHDVIDTRDNYADLLRDVNDTQCRTQKGNIYDRVIATVKCRLFLLKQAINRLKMYVTH